MGSAVSESLSRVSGGKDCGAVGSSCMAELFFIVFSIKIKKGLKKGRMWFTMETSGKNVVKSGIKWGEKISPLC